MAFICLGTDLPASGNSLPSELRARCMLGGAGQGVRYRPDEPRAPACTVGISAVPWRRGIGPRGQSGRECGARKGSRDQPRPGEYKEWAGDKKGLPEPWRLKAVIPAEEFEVAGSVRASFHKKRAVGPSPNSAAIEGQILTNFSTLT